MTKNILAVIALSALTLSSAFAGDVVCNSKIAVTQGKDGAPDLQAPFSLSAIQTANGYKGKYTVGEISTDLEASCEFSDLSGGLRAEDVASLPELAQLLGVPAPDASKFKSTVTCKFGRNGIDGDAEMAVFQFLDAKGALVFGWAATDTGAFACLK